MTVTTKVIMGKSSAGSQRYRDKVDEGKEAPLFTATRHCSHNVELQIQEWRAVREEHGTQGARRAPRAKHEAVDPETGLHSSGKRGTHVRYHDGKRWRKRPVREGETPTHLRIEPEDVVSEKEDEVVHTIVAFSADSVNPEDPEEMERAWQAINHHRDEAYPGIQESRWAERNGESGLFHVHVVSNSTIYEDFELDGRQYRAGQKMAGDLTNVHSIRRRFDDFLDRHPEYGLKQQLARVGTQEYRDAQRRDGQHAYWEKARAQREGLAPKETNQDRIRRLSHEVLTRDGVDDHDAYVAELKAEGIEVEEVGLRRGKPGKNHDFSYRVRGAKNTVRGKTLGSEYSYQGVGAQLQLKAAGQEIEPPSRQRAGEAKPLPLTGELTAEQQAELDQLRAEVEAMADAERTAQRPLSFEERMRQRQEELEAEKARWAEQDAARAAEFELQQKMWDDPLAYPPEQYAGLSDEEMTREVEEKLVVIPETPYEPRDGSIRRTVEERGIEAQEANFLRAKWYQLGKPETEYEREFMADVRARIAERDAEIARDLQERQEQQTPEAEQREQVEEPVAEQATAEEPAVQEQEPVAAEPEPEPFPRRTFRSRRPQQEQQPVAAPEVQEQPSTTEPQEQPSVAAPAPQPVPGRAEDEEREELQARPQPFRSALRDVEAKGGSESVQRRIDAVAGLEEDYRGREPDAEFEARLSEVKGVGQQFIDHYGDRLGEDMRSKLAAREESKAAKQDAYAHAKAADDSDEFKSRLQDHKLVSERQRAGDYAGAVKARPEEARGAAERARAAEQAEQKAAEKTNRPAHIQRALAQKGRNKEVGKKVKAQEQTQDRGMEM